MAAKVEWTAIDYAARNKLAKVIDDSGIAYRVIAERMGGAVSHVRIGYIHNGEKAPVRLSEFLGICDVCGADPVQTLRQIINEAKRLQTEQDTRERETRHQTNTDATTTATTQSPTALAGEREDVDIDAWADRIREEDGVRARGGRSDKPNEMSTPRE